MGLSVLLSALVGLFGLALCWILDLSYAFVVAPCIAVFLGALTGETITDHVIPGLVVMVLGFFVGRALDRMSTGIFVALAIVAGLMFGAWAGRYFEEKPDNPPGKAS